MNKLVKAVLLFFLVLTSAGAKTLVLSNPIKERFIRFYNELEKVGEKHKELYDTEVRENLYKTLNYYFVWGKTTNRMPKNYSMFSRTGDRLVSNIVNIFIEDSLVITQKYNIAPGKPRLKLLQDMSVKTTNGKRYYEFIGSSEKMLMPKPIQESRFTHITIDDRSVCVKKIASQLHAQIATNNTKQVTYYFDKKSLFYTCLKKSKINRP